MCLKNAIKNSKQVTPEGGWGCLICVAITINLIVLTGFSNCYSMMFKEKFLELNMGSTSIGLLNGFGVICIGIAGFSTGILLNYITLRKLGVASAILYIIGSFGTALCNSTTAIFIFQGILQNFGHGVMLNITFTIFNRYFIRKKLYAMSVAQTIVALTTFVTPTLVKWLLDRYGCYWTLLLISGIRLHTLIAVALMQPPCIRKRNHVPEKKESELKEISMEDRNVCSKQLGAGSVDSNRLIPERKNVTNTDVEARYVIANFRDKELCKGFVLSNACLGLSVCVFSDLAFLSMLPPALYYMGWSGYLVTWAIRLFGISNIVTRVLFILCSKWLGEVGTHEIYVIGILIACLSRLGMLWSDNRPVMLTFIAIIGTSRACMEIMYPLVVSDAVSSRNFSNAMGISMLSYGVISVVLGPAINAVYILTDSYATVFYILTSCFAIVLIFWTIELVYKKNAHKRRPRRSVSEKMLHSSLK